MIKNSQYCFDISVGVEGSSRGVLKDFLEDNDLVAFKMELMSGVAVPYFTVSIKVHSEEISAYFRQGSKITLSVGTTERDIRTYNLEIGTVRYGKADTSTDDISVTFEAVISNKSTKFILNTDTLIENGTSLEVLEKLAKRFFNTELDTDINSVNETSMRWRQDSVYNNSFLASVWLHMGLAPDVPLIYIDTDLVVHLKSLNKIKESKPKYIFTPNQPKAGSEQIHFTNVFSPQSYKGIINALTSNQIINVKHADSGYVDIIFPDVEKPDLASTKEVEKSESGNTVKHNRVESLNVYRGYKQAYHFNRSRLNALSSITGDIDLIGFRDEFKIFDLALVEGVSEDNSGKYLISDIVITCGHGQPLITTLFLTRDNINRLEKYVLKSDEDNAFFQFKTEIQKFYGAVRNLRKYVQKGRYILDGSLQRDLTKFVHSLKYNLLRSFTVCGTSLDFNSTKALFSSLKSASNTMLNNIVKMYLPAPFNTMLQNYALQDPTLKGLASRLLTMYAPQDMRLLLVEIQGLLSDITMGLGRVSKNASIAQSASTLNSTQGIVTFTDTPNGVVNIQVKDKDMNTKDKSVDERLSDIIQGFLDNTKNMDIPIPIIDLTESQRLLNDLDLRNLVADKIVQDLNSRGYLEGINNFDDILLGNTEVSFSLVNQINNNTGLVMSSRYWGTFKDTTELTDFYITDQFRDMYKSPSCTRLINAKRGEKLFIAFPTYETELKFFINSVMQVMDVMEDIDLGIKNKNGAPILYNVYLSKQGYNSNSNILEVRE